MLRIHQTSRLLRSADSRALDAPEWRVDIPGVD